MKSSPNPSFSIAEVGPHGPTCFLPDPKRAAYSQAAYIQNVLGRTYVMTLHEDGQITLQGDGLERMTYAKG